MKGAILAVAGQLILSVSNYAVFLLCARLLPREDFIGFSTAVGVNMFAAAVAEGGISYVAPRELSDRSSSRTGSVAGAFMTVSLALYVASLSVSYISWTVFSKDPLQPRWVAAYALYYAPVLMIPAWMTCWSMDGTRIAALAAARFAMVAAICLAPGPLTLGCAGLAFLVFVGWFLAWLGGDGRVLDWPDGEAFRVAVGRLREVFVVKTLSYATYCLMPLAVGALRGNAAASHYVTGERLKALYATMFQPLLQSIYLWQFQSSGNVVRRRQLIWALNMGNLVVFAGTLACIRAGLLPLLGERFDEVTGIGYFFTAAALSVTTTSLLYLHVFPSGRYRVFHRAGIGQAVAFVLLFLGMAFFPGMEPAWALCCAEAVFLVGIIIQSKAGFGIPRGYGSGCAG